MTNAEIEKYSDLGYSVGEATELMQLSVKEIYAEWKDLDASLVAAHMLTTALIQHGDKTLKAAAMMANAHRDAKEGQINNG